MLYIKHKIQKYRESQYFLKHFFSWAQGQMSPNDIILGDFLSKGEVCYVKKNGSFSLAMLSFLKEPNPVFIVCRAGTFNQFVEAENLIEVINTKKSWKCVFSSFSIEVWEDISRHKQDVPIRFGLNDNERTYLLSTARSAIRHFLSKNSTLSSNSFKCTEERLLKNEKCTVGVTLWVKGVLRGSRVYQGNSILDAVILAAIKSCRDPRFKPLSQSELEDLRIQITVLSDLRLPLLKSDIRERSINVKNGYQVVHKEKIGFHVPAIFNYQKFSHSTEFFENLTAEKVMIDDTSVPHSVLLTYHVDDFIEPSGFTKKTNLPLFGSMLKINTSSKDLENDYREMFNVAGDWVLHLQHADGYIPAIVRPHADKKQHLWSHMMFTAYALGEFGTVRGNERYYEGALRAFEYFYTIFSEFTTINLTDITLSTTYLGQLALTLNKEEVAIECAEKLISSLYVKDTNSFLLSQITMFFYRVSDVIDDYSFGMVAESIYNKVFEDLENKINSKSAVSLATYIESIKPIQIKSRHLEKNNDIENRRTKMLAWFLSTQNSDGSFPNTQYDRFAYARGTAKLFEVLAGDEENKEVCTRTLQWLYSMQYNAENTFFIPTDMAEDFIGGFRNDMQNYDAWINTAGHVLLGASKFMKH